MLRTVLRFVPIGQTRVLGSRVGYQVVKFTRGYGIYPKMLIAQSV